MERLDVSPLCECGCGSVLGKCKNPSAYESPDDDDDEDEREGNDGPDGDEDPDRGERGRGSTDPSMPGYDPNDT